MSKKQYKLTGRAVWPTAVWSAPSRPPAEQEREPDAPPPPWWQEDVDDVDEEAHDDE
jgi:hypothetical protein